MSTERCDGSPGTVRPTSLSFPVQHRGARFHLTARDAELVEQLQFAPELAAGDLAGEQLAVARQRATNLGGILVHEFDAEASCAQLDQAADVLGSGLRAIVENRVAATGVRPQRQLSAHAIAQRDA